MKRYRLPLSILILVTFVTTGALFITWLKSDININRATNCPLNQKGFEVGDFVLILVSGQKGQILSLPQYRGFSGCRAYSYAVRFNSHGIAVDGGLWNSSKPEVLPIIFFQEVEIARWAQ